MNHINGDDQNIHHDPSDLLPEEILKKLTELLEQLHELHNSKIKKLKKEKIEKLEKEGIENEKNEKEKSVQINIYEKGSQHIDKQINVAPPCPSPAGRGNRRGEEDYKGRVKGTGEANAFKDDTPLSALFRVNFHEKLRKVIESWRPYLISDDKNVDALAMNRFEFDKKRIYSNRVYYDLLDLEALGALQVSLSQLACYLADHSNLSSSYTALYQQLKRYRQECQ